MDHVGFVATPHRQPGAGSADDRFAFVQSRRHRDVVDRGRYAFPEEMARLGVPSARIDVLEVPGVFELPLHAKLLAEKPMPALDERRRLQRTRHASSQPQEQPVSMTKSRAEAFCRRFALRLPILLAPMAGASTPSLSIAVAKAGGLGACGALLMKPREIAAWAEEVRRNADGPFQLNLWIPDPPPKRDPEQEARLRDFLAGWGPAVPPEAGDAAPPDFASQCAALLEAAPPAVSSVMGLYRPDFVAKLKERGIAWFANISTVAEARAAEAAGADVIVAQGSEAGGHRGCFDAAKAEREQVGLFALLPAVVDAVSVPVVATGGIADGRGVAAALALGASAAQIGTGFLRCPEAKIHPAWADALARTAPEDTMVSRVFSGRAGRSIATSYVRAATAESAPAPAPYPVQRGLTAAMRSAGQKEGDIDRMQAWAGQSAALAKAEPAGELIGRIWADAQALLA